MQISVGCKLRYGIDVPTGFAFQFAAAKADGQLIVEERIGFPPDVSSDLYADPISLNRILRATLGPGPIEVDYEALVEVDATEFDPSRVGEFEFANLPMQYLGYLAPSRYCPSDTFTDFAQREFGALPKGHRRVTAVSDWVHANIAYRAGSTNSASSAEDVFHQRAGVCRDFSHLGISLCRALGIPARYASVYADRLEPQDFHAIFQAFLIGPHGGAWYTFDPTHMCSVDAVVRIAAGQDAADVAFAWPQGPVASDPPVVWARAQARADLTRTTQAVAGA